MIELWTRLSSYMKWKFLKIQWWMDIYTNHQCYADELEQTDRQTEYHFQLFVGLSYLQRVKGRDWYKTGLIAFFHPIWTYVRAGVPESICVHPPFKFWYIYLGRLQFHRIWCNTFDSSFLLFPMILTALNQYQVNDLNFF